MGCCGSKSVEGEGAPAPSMPESTSQTKPAAGAPTTASTAGAQGRVAWPHGIWTIWQGAKTNGSFLGPISQETPVTELHCIFCCNLVFPNGTRKTSGQRAASLDGIQREASQSTTGPDEGDGQT